MNTTIHSPFESALRVLVILCHVAPRDLDIPQLVALDYLLIHSEDFGGPASIHPPTPHRTGELLVKIDLVDRGLHLLVTRDLARISFGSNGLSFRALDFAAVFLDSLQSEYCKALRNRAEWMATKLETDSIESIVTWLSDNMLKLGSEQTAVELLAEVEA